MSTTLKLTAALFLGLAMGALGIDSLRAQGKPSAFLVAEFEVTDPVEWKRYLEATKALPPNGGVFLARAARGTGLSGAPPKTVTIVQFPTLDDAIAFDASAEYTALKPLRDKSSNWRSYVVEGLPR
jgi:uncharacterized protein (DUF1330 family)